MSESKTKIPNPKFHSPIPFIIQFRNFVFGKEKPDIFTKLAFFINLFGVSVFGLWATISYFSIIFRKVFLTERRVDVEAIIYARGEALGYDGESFMDHLTTFNGISMVLWLIAFISLIMLWRKMKNFVWVYFTATLFYLGMMIFYVGFNYFLEDTTMFDKILFLAMNLFTLMYYFLMKKDEKEVGATFFD